jgi:PAS domain S-box-containing protein
LDLHTQPPAGADGTAIGASPDGAGFLAPNLHPAQRALYESLPDGVLLVRDATIVFANRAAADLLAARAPSCLQGRPVAALMSGAEPPPALVRPRAANAGPETIEIECVRLDGSGCALEVSLSSTRLGNRPAVQALLRDATARRLQHALQSHVRRVLRMMADEAAFGEILRVLCESAENVLAGSARCGVAMLDADRRRMTDAARGSLPEAYGRLIHGLEIGPDVGSCGAALHRGERVVCEDVSADPDWTAFRERLAGWGLRSCFSTPMSDPDGVVVGCFAVYHDRPHRPGRTELEVVDTFVQLAEEALRRDRLRAAMRRDRLRHESVLQAVGAAVMVFRGDGKLARWNPGAQRLLGLDAGAFAGWDARRLFEHAILEDGTPLSPEDSPIDRCLATRRPQRDRVIGLRSPEGERRWVAVDVHPVSGAGDDGHDDDAVVCSLSDVTAIKSAQARLEQLARTDGLTGLPNRLAMQAELARDVAAAAGGGTGLGVLVLDLNGFKHVNDTLGQAAATRCWSTSRGGSGRR